MTPIDFYTDEYKEMYEVAVKACACISRNSCSRLGEEVGDISSTVAKISLRDVWQDQLGEAFSEVIEKCTSAIDSIVASINSTFKTSESHYNLLKTTLEELKELDSKYKEEIKNEPNLYSDPKYQSSSSRVDEYGYPIVFYDRSQYEIDHKAWAERVHHLQTNCETCQGTIKDIKSKLDSINGQSVLTGEISSLGGIDVQKTFTVVGLLPIMTDRDWILQRFKTSGDPFHDIYSQSSFSDVYINRQAGKTLASSGCGMISAAVCISCALSKAYGTNVAITPRDYANLLEENGYSIDKYFNSNYDYSWNTYEDTTRIIKDISVIKLKSIEDRVKVNPSDNAPCFTDESLQNVLEAGGIPQVSLIGRGHVVPVTEYCGDNQYYVAESSNPESKIVALNGKVFSYSRSTYGTIDGKNAAIFIPNQNLELDFSSGTINGLDATGLQVESVIICGNTYSAHVTDDRIIIDDVSSLNSNLAALQNE